MQMLRIFLKEGPPLLRSFDSFRNNPAEIKQKELNEPWFKTIKSIIHDNLSTMTISEIKELNGSLTEELSARQREANWTEITEDGNSELELPALPDVVLERILSSLPTKDILTCRLVCQGWKLLATMKLRKRVCKFFTINCPRPQQESGTQHHTDSLWRFMEVMKESQLLPLVSFHLGFENLEGHENCAGIQAFFQLFGPIIRNLRLDFTQLKPLDDKALFLPKIVHSSIDPHAFSCGAWYCLALTRYLGSAQLIELQNLEIIFDRREILIRDLASSRVRLGEDVRSMIMSTFLTAAGNLKQIRLTYGENLFELVQSLVDTNPRNLTGLNLECRYLMEKELEELGKLKLTRLTLNPGFFSVSPPAMQIFLQKQSQSLKYLKLFSYDWYISNADEDTIAHSHNYFPDFAYEFPIMEKLVVFTIDWNQGGLLPEIFRCSPINWPISFPKLKEFKMRGPVDSDCLKCLFPKDKLSMKTTHINLNMIKFPCGILTTEVPALDIHAIGRMFPNVYAFKVPFKEFVDHSSIFPVFSNIKKLVLHAEDEICEEKDEESFVTRKMRALKNLVWKLELNDDKIEYYCERLKTMAVEIKISHFNTDLGMVRRTYDCAWFLRHLRERVKLEEIVAEQRKTNQLMRTPEELDANSVDHNSSESESNDGSESEEG